MQSITRSGRLGPLLSNIAAGVRYADWPTHFEPSEDGAVAVAVGNPLSIRHREAGEVDALGAGEVDEGLVGAHGAIFASYITSIYSLQLQKARRKLGPA